MLSCLDVWDGIVVMSSILDRALNIVEILANSPGGLQLYVIAERLDIPRSAAHRLLGELARLGYVEQDEITTLYQLTLKVASLGQTYLSLNGILDIAQPVLERLAEKAGELVRLGIVNDHRLTWIAKAQGARSGFRYDPDAGMDAHLASTSSGHAWLATLSDEEALRLVSRQGFGDSAKLGPNAAMTVQALLKCLALARQDGYALNLESSAPGLSAIAIAIQKPGTTRTIGALSIAGPATRLPEAQLRALAPVLRAAAAELSAASLGSSYFGGVRHLTRSEEGATSV